jgi:hypothetical protein
MTTWTTDELKKIGTADELEIAPLRRDRTQRNPVSIWVVRLNDDLYVRSYKGRAGRGSAPARRGTKVRFARAASKKTSHSSRNRSRHECQDRYRVRHEIQRLQRTLRDQTKSVR